MSETEGIIGPGTMGLPMLSNLAHKGIALVVHDASPRRRAGCPMSSTFNRLICSALLLAAIVALRPLVPVRPARG